MVPLRTATNLNPCYADLIFRNMKSIHILYHFSMLRWSRYLKSFLLKDKGLFILHVQYPYHGCWWPGNARRPGSSSHGRGCCEIWEALVLRTSNMTSALVRNQMCTYLSLIKLICAIIICSSIGRVSSDSHLSDKAKIAFRTIGRPFWRPLHGVALLSNL